MYLMRSQQSLDIIWSLTELNVILSFYRTKNH